jgi:nucleoside-diphosphate-sugar epimerase
MAEAFRRSPRNILVTGGCGYIGSALVPELLAEPGVERVTVADNLSRGRLESIAYLLPRYGERIRFVRTDLRRQPQVDHLFDQFGPFDAVVHLGATVDAATSLDEDKRILCEEVNERATLALAATAAQHGVATFIAHSSTSVYGHGGADVLTEESPCRPVTPYGTTKLASERILDLQSGTTDVIVFRPASVFGWAPGYRYEVAVNLLALYAHVGVPLTVYRTAERENRPYLSIGDCVRSLRTALDRPADLAGQVWNVVSFNAPLAEILDVIFRLYPDASREYTDAALVNQISFTVSGEKLYRAGFSPEGDLHDSLREVKEQLDRIGAQHGGWLDARRTEVATAP